MMKIMVSSNNFHFLAKEAIEEAQTSAIALGSKRKAEMDEKEAKKLEKKKKKKWYEASSGQGSTHHRLWSRAGRSRD